MKANDILDETIFYKIDLQDFARDLFTTNYPIIGKLFDQTDEHLYVHKFASDINGIIHYGFVERIPRHMIGTIEELKEPNYESK